jgi:hypothetical protein
VFFFLIAAGVCPSVLSGAPASSRGDEEQETSAGGVGVGAGAGGKGRTGNRVTVNRVLRICKSSKAVRWGPIDESLRSSFVAAAAVGEGGGGGRTEIGGGSVLEIYGVVGMVAMSFNSFLIVATYADVC